MSPCQSFRRGSALMVSLALLMMLAVFAALFLTSSRFDAEGSTADLDAVRMDLYAEGMAQYIQTCMVAGLWGFDDKPLNYDDVTPGSGPPARTPQPGVSMTQPPGPDAPFTYYGGRVLVDPTGSYPTGTDWHWYYPNFWLSDPRVQRDTAVSSLTFMHAAFDPDPGRTVPFGDTTYPTPPLQWQYADLDGDDRADTPYLFHKPLGNGLYLRAAVRVEDTSSRINVQTADRSRPIDPGGAAATNYPYEVDLTSPAFDPYLQRQEALLRKALYPGYPWIATRLTSPPSEISRFNDMMLVNGGLRVGGAAGPDWEQPGCFLGEMNLTGAMDRWLNSPAVAADPDRYLDTATESANLRAGMLDSGGVNGRPVINPPRDIPGACGQQGGAPGARYPGEVYRATGTGAVPPELALLVGNPITGDPGRFGDILNNYALWDPANPTNWATFDPDALARRLEAPPATVVAPLEQDRPFEPAETFKLMHLSGQNAAIGLQGYEPSGAWPGLTRMEELWRDPLVQLSGSHGLQWRKILTGYSWTLDLCPYGEDPYGLGSHRKVNLNVPVDLNNIEPLDIALQAAARHSTISGGAVMTDDQRRQFVANFRLYRARQMNVSDLAYYLLSRHRTYQAGQIPTAPPPSANLAWNQLAWERIAGSPGAAEQGYLDSLFAAWGTPVFWTQVRTIMTTAAPVSLGQNPYVSNVRPRDYAYSDGTNTYFGQCRQPFITEVYADVSTAEIDPTNQPGVLGKDDLRERNISPPNNHYALELYNPWDTYIYLDDWYIRIVRNEMIDPTTSPTIQAVPPYTIELTGFIPPRGRYVIANAISAAPRVDLESRELVLATHPGMNLLVELIYQPGGAGGPMAVYDVLSQDWTSGLVLGSNVARDAGGGIASLVRRDDDGFWCYQRWANQWSASDVLTATLGQPNFWNLSNGNSMAQDPWPTNVGNRLGPNPTVPVVGVGHLLSPAELMLIPFDVPRQMQADGLTPRPGGTQTYADAITPYPHALDPLPNPRGSSSPGQTPLNRFSNVGMNAPYVYPLAGSRPQPVRPLLFNRHYVEYTGGPTTPNNRTDNQSAWFVGQFQALMDFVTTYDYTQDGVNNPGNGPSGGDAPVTNAPTLEMRIPGRLNINTVSDWWSLRQMDLLVNVPASTNLDHCFWRRLLEYRDERDPYLVIDSAAGAWFPGPGTRRFYATSNGTVNVRDATSTTEEHAFLGFEHLGEVCNVQRSGADGFNGFWQNPLNNATLYGMLPQQSLRRFARNMHLLTTRSDTFMITLRVEIVRPTVNPPTDPTSNPGLFLANLQRIEVLGQKEYMYLVDRSYCTQAPQTGTDWGGPTNRLFNGRVNSAYVPPKVWRMTVPR